MSLRRVLLPLVLSAPVLLPSSPAIALICDGTLQQVSVPVPGDTLYHDVTARSATRAWAVGSVTPTGAEQDRGIVIRWNGTAWKEVGPLAQSARFVPRAIDAASATSLWTAGRRQRLNGGDDGSMIESFDGTTWNVEAQITFTGGFLHEVAAIASDDVWVAGERNAGGTGRVMLYHHDGADWEKVPLPTPSGSTELEVLDLEAGIGGDVWIVGFFIRSDGSERSLAYHFDGATWERVSTPNPGDDSTILSGVEPVAPDVVWAVGSEDGDTLALRWDGDTWTRVATANPGPSNALNDVEAIDPGDLWASGSTGPSFPPSPDTMAQRWQGTTWAVEPAPNPKGFTLLGKVAAVPSGAVFMVGVRLSGNPFMVQRCV